jgi:aspartate/methionine/tyrosine aminotransferase
MITREEQQALWELAVKHDFVIMSDEVYDRLVFAGNVAPSIAQVATDHDHLIVINSFSKTYNMTGWRLGWAMAGEKIISVLAKVEEFMTSSPPSMIQRAGITALRDGEPYVREVRDQYARRRQMVIDILRASPRVSLPEPEGAFYAFPQIEGLKDSMEFAKKLLRETGVALAPGVAFGPSGEGYLRLCFAASERVLGPALEKLSHGLHE